MDFTILAKLPPLIPNNVTNFFGKHDLKQREILMSKLLFIIKIKLLLAI